MSYYRRGYSWEQLEQIPAPVTWSPTAAVDAMGEGEALILDNFIVRQGKIVMRGGIVAYTDTNPADANPLAPVSFIHNPSYGTLIGRQDVNAGGWVQPWKVPICKPATAIQLAQANTRMILTAATVPPLLPTSSTLAAVTRDHVPGPFVTRIGDDYYAMAYDTPAAAVASGSTWFRPVPLLRITATGAPNATTPYTTAPTGSLHAKTYQDRLWLSGGVNVPGGGTTNHWDALYFTTPIALGAAVADVASQWQDPVTGLTNRISVGTDKEAILGTAVWRNSLLIFKYRSIYVLRGSTPSTYSVQAVTTDLGCLDPRSIIECDTGVYFMSDRGLMVTDGVRVTNVSGSVQANLYDALNVYHGLTLATVQAGNTRPTTHIMCAKGADGSIIVTVGYLMPNTLVPMWSGIYSPASHTWTRITSAIFDTGDYNAPSRSPLQARLPCYVVSQAGSLFALGDRSVFLLEGLDYGLSYARPAEGQGIASPVVAGPGDVDRSYVVHQIPALWMARFSHLANPAKKNTILHRVITDYLIQPIDMGFQTIALNGGWTIALLDSSGANITPPWRPPQAVEWVGGLPKPWIQHHTQDVLNEVVDADLVVYWDQANTVAPVVAEIHGVTLEYQPASERR